MTDEQMNDLIEEQAGLQTQIDAADAWDIERKVRVAMDALRCPPSDESVKTLSGGEKRLITLASVLAMKPEVLLLDEPSNALDKDARIRLIEVLQSLSQAMIIISHEPSFLDALVTRRTRLEGGKVLNV